MPNESAFAPRIYYVSPLLIGPLSAWDNHLDRAAAMGFDHVLIAPPFLPGASNDIFVTADHQRLNPVFESDLHVNEALGELSRKARARGLSLLLDIPLDRVAADGGLAADHPDWFVDSVSHGGIDPRAHADPRLVHYANFARPESADRLVDWWAQQLREFLDAGVVGFRFDAPRQAPGHIWRRLAAAVREKHPLARFLAWTPGLARQEQIALTDAGFDAVFSSLAWWNGRDSWFLEEYTALSRVAPPIAFPEEPYGRRLATLIPDASDPVMVERAYVRSMRVANVLGCGVLIPMGFEFGVAEALSREHGSPAQFTALAEAPPLDLRDEIARVNGLVKPAPVLGSAGALLPLTGPDAKVTAVLRTPLNDWRVTDEAALILINPDLRRDIEIDGGDILDGIPGEFTEFAPLADPDAVFRPLGRRLLEAGEVRVFAARRPASIRQVATGKRSTKAAERKQTTEATRVPRIAIEDVTPVVDGGRFPAKRVVGETLAVEADVFLDGHDQLSAAVRYRPASADAVWQEAPMRALGNDRFVADVPLERLGAYEFSVLAWRDSYGSLIHHLERKLAVGQEVKLEVEEARLLIAAVADAVSDEASETERAAADKLHELGKRLKRAKDDDRLALVVDHDTSTLIAATGVRDFFTASPVYRVLAERSAARFASWYELFPRSQSGDATRHGTFIDVIARLPQIAAMGFDVLYFPPIHPIGRANRKGPNNTLTAGPDDVGSPYAIGDEHGGHDAIHPELGSFDDFRALLDAAHAHGLEVALDFAIQCSPDHPWLKEHPTWFAWRPDGTLRYAENPPKKYQDIVNPDFYADDAIPALWLSLRDVILFWVAAGVQTFRVDNPHTKPLPFWEWMIGEVRQRHPEVIFLSEAFTRPKVMNRLAKVGFGQSYTYFTWRETKDELTEYLTQLSTGPEREFFRPNFFVNTPDINPKFLQRSGRAGFVIRAALAATLSGLWGVYSGFELCEAAALPNSEEYLDSEKYQVRVWDWNREGNIIEEISLLNRLRRANPALHSHLNIRFLPSSNPNVLFFEKSTRARDNVVLVAITLDPFAAQDADVELPLWRWGLADDAALRATDLVSGERFEMRGKWQRLRLDPAVLPFAIRRVTCVGGWPDARDA
ncbi:maltotransferase domain-containing protein [Chitinasiproducens palmae]|uniref:Alpha-1,4-glucan:maltose-1-phosphate maltosyltransferase n=1 Tax=Chitinasiproducens palmae TaxID=1770053 RepID=A0A1H2PM97_9BURK|nr:maltotransferase domain-containing protein [Chitinasiproducens palmae]SDV47650.1 starch synthase (maltosyl-transferring) [Chitinasiproducens palmae]